MHCGIGQQSLLDDRPFSLCFRAVVGFDGLSELQDWLLAEGKSLDSCKMVSVGGICEICTVMVPF